MTSTTRAPTGIVRSDFQIVDDIRNLLEHHYHEESFVREMIQNADDAHARRLHLQFRPDGLGPTASNPLLQGPLLLIANDGPLTTSDEGALRQASGGNKATDESKVGRFGLGLKSIFHWCETFLYCGAANGSAPRTGVVDPYVGQDGRDPINPEWQDVSKDEQALATCLRDLLAVGSECPNGLLLCAPLRIEAHLNRDDERLARWQWPDGLRSVPPMFDVVEALDSHSGKALVLAELVLVLAQCGYLHRVSGSWPGGSFEVARRDDPAPQALGRPSLQGDEEELPNSERELRSTIDVSIDARIAWSVDVFGRERTGPLGKELRGDPGWPIDLLVNPNRQGARRRQPRKALGHGGVTVIRWPQHPQLAPRLAARWAAFLPLDMQYQVARESNVSKAHPARAAVDVILHGYFFPKPDRKGIDGLTAPASGVVSEWNRSVVNMMCLPLLPEVLACATASGAAEACSELRATAEVLKALHIEPSAVVKSTLLVPCVTPAQTRYEAIEALDLHRLRPVQAWNRASSVPWLRRACLDHVANSGMRLFEQDFVVDFFLPTLPTWAAAEFRGLLQALRLPDKATADEVGAVVEFIIESFPRPRDLGNSEVVADAALCWLQQMQAAGWGVRGRKWAADEESSLKTVDILKWLGTAGGRWVAVSRGAAPAIERLAADGKPPLLLVPNGGALDCQVDEMARVASTQLLPELALRIAEASDSAAKSPIGPKAWRLLARDLVRVVGLQRVAHDPKPGSPLTDL